MFNQIELDTIKDIYNNLIAYPEGPVAYHFWRTPCHAAAFTGNCDKLRFLMSAINDRYEKNEGNERKF